MDLIKKILKGYIIYFVISSIIIGVLSKLYIFDFIVQYDNYKPQTKGPIIDIINSGFKSNDPEVQKYLEERVSQIDNYIKTERKEIEIGIKKYLKTKELFPNTKGSDFVDCFKANNVIKISNAMNYQFKHYIKEMKEYYPGCIHHN